MASISEDKIREMEEEMNRFEKEISQSSVPAVPHHGSRFNVPDIRPVIGARTYHKVAKQLHLQQHPQMGPSPHMMGGSPAPILQPPPQPPNFGNLGPMRMPAPPQSHLQFVPHQLRNPAPVMHIRPPDSMNVMAPTQSSTGFSQNFNMTPDDKTEPKPVLESASTDSSTSSVTVSSTPVVISAKPTVYSANPTNNIIKPPVREVIIPEKPIVTSVPVVVSSSIYNSSATTSTSKVGPSVYPQISLPEEKKKEKKVKKIVRTAGGQVWDDNTLLEWEQDDFRVFCGDLGNDVTDEVLTRAFSRYSSFLKAKVVRDKRTNKTRGYGFISFKDPQDFIKAMKDMNGKYVGSRPIKLRKSSWKDRNVEIAKKKAKEKQRLGLR